MPGDSPFVLASNSPRRRILLREAGFTFEILSPRLDERETPHLSLRELTITNALRKARIVGAERPSAVILGADTLVSLDGEPIGKPRNLNHARAILGRLSGKVHEVCTSVVIVAPNRPPAVLSEVSRVRFRDLSDAAIADYLATINPFDKAGAYAAQGAAGGKIIVWVEGSFTNVIGLPMERVVPALAQFGIAPASNAFRPRLQDPELKHAPVRASKHDRETRQ